ncbi:hypothetical protein EW146_g3179 [Bondarzewia mesenterica]|uniref:Uncharacterized protein n=1 Tax=Bondarzewia mesenterica TaxID=1095465 RepID=A0A4S4M0K9_9AGAM|nr:hypothetical protein EW146_g3179 [Bondarzewia mesenterica]
MENAASTSNAPSDTKPRGRGRGRSRGGLGKYLRARGRGQGGGRPAEFHQRLVLEGERSAELDEEETEELQKKYARRHLASNADRYAEPEPEIGSDGEEILEPEVDLSKFLERQRREEVPQVLSKPEDEEDDDVDYTLSHISAKGTLDAPSRKGKVQQIEWDAELEEMTREKAAAEANWDLKTRFRVKAAQQQRGRIANRGGAPSRAERRQEKSYVEAPPLPTQQDKPAKDPKPQMEAFLDDLLG